MVIASRFDNLALVTYSNSNGAALVTVANTCQCQSYCNSKLHSKFGRCTVLEWIVRKPIGMRSRQLHYSARSVK